MTTYYVGSGGSDSNNGTTWALRKLTLNGAEDIPVAAGDTVYVGPGIYRETLTLDVSGSDGNPITYVGDYTGANTDGAGGVVRITGSDNDQTATRNYCISNLGDHDYRTFRGFSYDMSISYVVYADNCDHMIIEDSGFQLLGAGIYFNGAAQASNTIRRCLFLVPNYGITAIVFNHSAVVDNTAQVVENCLFVGSMNGIVTFYVGGITARNCSFIGNTMGCRVQSALTVGQTFVVNNCIFTNCNTGVRSTTATELAEDYNAFYGNVGDRVTTQAGANSVSYPPLFDMRWLFELTFNNGTLLSPFDLSSSSELVELNSGTGAPTADLRGTTVQGTYREWGALEYDSTLDIEGGASPDYPAEGDVEAGVVYGDSVYEGTFVVPAEADVEDGVGYGADGTEFEGTLVPGGGGVYRPVARVLGG